VNFILKSKIGQQFPLFALGVCCNGGRDQWELPFMDKCYLDIEALL